MKTILIATVLVAQLFTFGAAVCTSCSSNSECEAVDGNSLCAADVCSCKSGYYQDLACNDQCAEIIGSACSADNECTDRGDSNTQCIVSECQCKESFYRDPASKLCVKGLGSGCNTDVECQQKVDNSVCNRGACTCSNGYFEDRDSCFSIVGSGCANDGDCTSRGDPRVFCGGEGVCSCRPGFFRDTDGDYMCQEVFGQSCFNATECQEKNNFVRDNQATCTDNKCGCSAGSDRAPLDAIFNCQPLEFDMTCEVGQICLKLDPNAVCSENKCACDTKYGWMRGNNDQCVLAVGLGERCDPKSGSNTCGSLNAECSLVGTVDFHYRCLCNVGFIDVTANNGTRLCATQLTRVEDPDCRACEENRGRCYDLNQNGRMSGCVCPNTRSGDDCELINTKVTCTKDEMNICYEPHSGVDLSTGLMYAEGYKQDARCLAASDDARCGSGNYRLTLPIGNNTGPLVCGMRRVEDSANSYKYQTRLVVQKDRDVQEQDDRVFDTYCRFVTYIRADTGVGIGGWPGGGEGEDNDPKLTMYVRNALNEIIPRGVALRIGDRIKLDLFLMDIKNNYQGIKVKSCLASTDPVLPHPNAVVRPLIREGCPADDQSHITVDNNFKRVGGEPNHLQTGLFNVFRLSRGTALFLHCQVDVCLDENNCQPETCTSRLGEVAAVEEGDTLTAQGVRVKREILSTTSVALVGEIHIYDPDQEPINGLTQTQGIIVGVVCSIALIAVIALSVLAARLRKKKNTATPPPSTAGGIDHSITEFNTYENRGYRNYDQEFFRLQRTPVESIS